MKSFKTLHTQKKKKKKERKKPLKEFNHSKLGGSDTLDLKVIFETSEPLCRTLEILMCTTHFIALVRIYRRLAKGKR
jgi:hypothetical protein